jgi:hypothetical protein
VVCSSPELFWRQIAQSSMRPLVIVFDPPSFQDHPRFGQRRQDFPVEAFVAQLIVEALDIGLFPRCPGPDVSRLDGRVRR